MQKNYADFSKLSREEYGVMITEAKEMQSLLSDPKSNSISSTTETPLEEIFYIQEGMFNNQYGDLLSESDALERIEQTYTVSIHPDANGEYYIYNTDVAAFYNDLAAAVGLELDPSNSEIMVICDLNLESIDDVNGLAIIKAGISIAIQLPLPRIPGEGFWAANEVGSCAQSNGGIDASDYIQGYLNGKVRASINHCATAHPGTTAHATLWEVWVSFMPSYASTTSNYYSNTYPHFWKNNDNQCLGNTDPEWYALYSSADVLNGIGLTYAQNSIGSGNGNLELLYTDYSSHNNGLAQFGFPANHNLYHGGIFQYGVINCLP
jgi:hypothetical protein